MGFQLTEIECSEQVELFKKIYTETNAILELNQTPPGENLTYLKPFFDLTPPLPFFPLKSSIIRAKIPEDSKSGIHVCEVTLESLQELANIQSTENGLFDVSLSPTRSPIRLPQSSHDVDEAISKSPIKMRTPQATKEIQEKWAQLTDSHAKSFGSPSHIEQSTPAKNIPANNTSDLQTQVHNILQSLANLIPTDDTFITDNTGKYAELVFFLQSAACFKVLLHEYPFFKEFKFTISYPEIDNNNNENLVKQLAKSGKLTAVNKVPSSLTFEQHLAKVMKTCGDTKTYFGIFYNRQAATLANTIALQAAMLPDPPKLPRPSFLNHLRNKHKNNDSWLKAIFWGNNENLGAAFAFIKRLFELPFLLLTYLLKPQQENSSGKKFRAGLTYSILFIITPETIAAKSKKPWLVRLANVGFLTLLGCALGWGLGANFITASQHMFHAIGLGHAGANFISGLHASGPLVGVCLFAIVSICCNVIPPLLSWLTEKTELSTQKPDEKKSSTATQISTPLYNQFAHADLSSSSLSTTRSVAPSISTSSQHSDSISQLSRVSVSIDSSCDGAAISQSGSRHAQNSMTQHPTSGPTSYGVHGVHQFATSQHEQQPPAFPAAKKTLFPTTK